MNALSRANERILPLSKVRLRHDKSSLGSKAIDYILMMLIITAYDKRQSNGPGPFIPYNPGGTGTHRTESRVFK